MFYVDDIAYIYIYIYTPIHCFNAVFPSLCGSVCMSMGYLLLPSLLPTLAEKPFFPNDAPILLGDDDDGAGGVAGQRVPVGYEGRLLRVQLLHHGAVGRSRHDGLH